MNSINYNIDPVEVGLRSNFTQGHGSVIESGNYYRPTDAVSHQYGWVRPSGNQPPIVVPRHLTSVPGKDRLTNMLPVIPGEPVDERMLHYSADDPGNGDEGLFTRFIKFLGRILGRLLGMLGLGSAAASGAAPPTAAEPTGTAQPSGGGNVETQTVGLPVYTNNISNQAASQMGHTTIFSRTIAA